METETLAQKALRLLSEVPAEDFIYGEFTKDGKCCAIGHYQRLTSINPSDFSQENCSDTLRGNHSGSDIRIESRKYLKEKYKLGCEDISSVNNFNNVNGYTEPIIKDRVIHLLKDMVAEGL